jgi:hypothetical protein
MSANLEVLADAYLRHHATQKDEDFWAWQQVHEIVTSGDVDRAWEITLLLLNKANSDVELNSIAAGPLEDSIDIYGDRALDRFEEVAEHNPRIRPALGQAGVLFYYDEFDRWYSLIFRYGLVKDRVADRGIISKAMEVMVSFTNDQKHVYQYEMDMSLLLDKPFDDKAAQRLLQKACGDLLHFRPEAVGNLTEPRFTEQDLKQRVAATLKELAALGYRPSLD